MKHLTPIILFVYNRPEHTKKTLDALAANHLAAESELFIYVDGLKSGAQIKDIQKTQEVKKLAEAENRFKKTTIIASDFNKGLASSIIDGVTKTLVTNDRVIVLEDDLETSEYFLHFMNDTLAFYQEDNEVACISGYIYPVDEKLPETFFLRGADCWGWATWKRAWDLFEPDGKYLLDQLTKKKLLYDFNFFDSYPYSKMLKDQIAGKNNSWAVRWYASAYLHEKLTLYPSTSFVRNIGIDGSGTHSGKRDFWQSKHLTGKIHLEKITPLEDKDAKLIVARYFTILMKKSLSGHVKYAILSILNRFRNS
ncbi:MAG: hypothetical protein ABIN89_31375 [Chitinophagaceae bacterium]